MSPEILVTQKFKKYTITYKNNLSIEMQNNSVAHLFLAI